MMHGGNGQLSVPPGFRFHPTDEELLYYYLKKKVSYEAIDLDVIREVDLNKLEPWDLREKCRIGTGPQNEWYFFSHKDKKYPTGTRTNRATQAGFWKATGRDKPIFLSNGKRIGMRKTLVFYTGRAPHGQKTDWIMHEYRLDDDASDLQQEDGWVVCRVFKKKMITRGYQAPDIEEEGQEDYTHQERTSLAHNTLLTKQHLIQQQQQSMYGGYQFDGPLNLPHLSSPESALPPHVANLTQSATPTFLTPMSLNNIDLECSQNLLRLTTTGPSLTQPVSEHQKFGGDWLFLDKLLTNYQTIDHQNKGNHQHHQVAPVNVVDINVSGHHHQKFPFQYLGCEPGVLKYSK